MREIAKHYIEKIIPSEFYLAPNPCNNRDILYPPFLELVYKGIEDFKKFYPESEVAIVETYRSNKLQEKYYRQGASRIKKDGMHHYGIAVDLAFRVDDKITYNGDYKTLRECMKKQGLILLGLWDAGHVQFIPVDEQLKLREAVVRAVKEFQLSNGLTLDGIIGGHTIGRAQTLYR